LYDENDVAIPSMGAYSSYSADSGGEDAPDSEDFTESVFDSPSTDSLFAHAGGRASLVSARGSTLGLSQYERNAFLL
jgi:hypothetical protein